MVARAQQTARVYRLGILTVGPDRNWDQLLQGLRDLGYVAGQNLIIEWRYSKGHAERWFDLVNDLVEAKVDIIVVSTTPAAVAAKKATGTIPIVFPTAFDPVGAGLVNSLARPGANVTGLGLFIPEVTAKGLELLKEAVPSLAEVAISWNPANQANSIVRGDVETTARALGLKLHSQSVREPKECDSVHLTDSCGLGLRCAAKICNRKGFLATCGWSSAFRLIIRCERSASWLTRRSRRCRGTSTSFTRGMADHRSLTSSPAHLLAQSSRVLTHRKNPP